MGWRIAPGQSLRQCGWDGEHVVYNDLSGDTHLLSEIAWELLVALRQDAASVPELAARLGFDHDAHAEIATLLDSLHGLGLIEP